jgi:hypothetical protein
MNKILLFSSLILLSISCDFFNKNEKKELLAIVYNKYLYLSDIEDVLPKGISKDDSNSIIENYTMNWVKNQLMLKKAEINLSEEEKDLEKELNEYRTSLLTYKYKEQLVKQKLDTIVSNKSIQEYYQKYKNNFVLKEDIIKYIFIKLNNNAPEIRKLRKLARNNDQESINGIKDYCYNYAQIFDINTNKWVSVNELTSTLPAAIVTNNNNTQVNSYIEKQDSTSIYFLKTIDKKTKGEIAPISYVSVQIKGIILNKRKIRFLENIEDKIYNDALSQGNVKYFN